MFDTVHEPVPAGLDQMTPGPVLGALLASIDVDRVSGHDRVVVLRAQQRMASHFQAQVYAAMASVADHMDHTEFADDTELAWEAAATEIRAALRLTRRAAESELGMAIGIRRRLPRVWNTLFDGDIDGRRARMILHGTSHLDDQAARRVVDAVIDDAPGLTTGELAARLRRLCIEIDPQSARERYAEAVAGRRLVTEASPDGTAHLLGMDLPPHRVAAVARRINRLALSINTPGDPRSMDQLRADVFLDLLSGIQHRATGGVVDLRVDLETLAGLSEAPGDLAGFGPVIADIARQVTQAQIGSEWRFTITAPRYRPHRPRRHHSPSPHRVAAPQCRGAGSHLHLPRMPHARHPMRSRPPHTVVRGSPHLRRRARPRMPPRSRHRPPPHRMGPPAPTRRRPPVDQPPRPQIHHQRQTPVTPPLRPGPTAPTRP